VAASSKPGSGSGVHAHERDAAVVADRVSKLYPGRRAVMFPPMLSLFQRDMFKRRRSRSMGDSESDSRTLRSRGGEDFDLIDEDDDDDLDDDDEDYYDEEPPPRGRPNEDFWALKDVSFSVPSGGALGVLGPPASGKTTLLAILGGHAFPTEGRVLVRDPVSPLPAHLTKGLRISEKGTFDFDLAYGSQMLALSSRVTKPYLREIEALAAPLVDSEGEPVRGWASRLAIATSIVVPGNVLLLEEEAVMDPEFSARIVERVHERRRVGAAVVVASRTAGLLRELCDEIIVLDEGKIADRGTAEGVLRRLEAGTGNGAAAQAGGRRAMSDSGSARGTVWQGRKLSVPAVVTPFNDRVALLSAQLSTPDGSRPKRVHTSQELVVEIELETALAEIEVRCGVDFLPSEPGATCIRIEDPKPLPFVEPGQRAIAMRTPPGTLPNGTYDVRVDAIVRNAQDRRTVIARDAGRVRIVGEGLDEPDALGEPLDHWDGRPCRVAAASWSVD
jgi:ABC-type polysaccharide/polyol phosphate transport system ATPase subunit